MSRTFTVTIEDGDLTDLELAVWSAHNALEDAIEHGGEVDGRGRANGSDFSWTVQ
jgi:hypothetical protein